MRITPTREQISYLASIGVEAVQSYAPASFAGHAAPEDLAQLAGGLGGPLFWRAAVLAIPAAIIGYVIIINLLS